MGDFAPARRLIAGTVLTSALLIADDAVAATQSDILKRFREQAPSLIEKHRGEIKARTDAVSARYRKERAQAERLRTARRAGRTTVTRGDLASAPRRIEQKGFHDGDTGAVVPLPLNPLLDPAGFLDDETGESDPVGALHRIAFYDFDADGDIDVFVGDKYGYIRYFENVGSVTEPDFEERFDGDNPFDGIDFANPGGDGPSDAPAPFLANVDGDAAPEAYVGTYDGDVLFFQLNGSGDFVQDDANNLVQPVLAAFEATLPIDEDVTYTVPHLVDIDNDDDLDVFLGTKEHGVLFFRKEGAVFVDHTGDGSNPLFGFTFFEHTAPFFADIDGDGDLDAFVGDNKYGGPIPLGFVRYFENDGSSLQERFEPGDHPLAGNLFTFGQPALADLDGDGDLDAFVGGKPLITMSFKNTGTAQSPAFLTTANGIEFFDYDGDGDLDAFVDLGKFGGVGYFENTGTVEEPQWTVRTGEDNPFDDFNEYISEYFGGELQYLPLGARPVVGNIDADPELEAFVGVALAGCKCERGPGPGLVPSRGIIPSDEVLGLLFYLERDNTGQFQIQPSPLPAPFFVSAPPPPAFFDGLPDPHLADIDGDNDLDLVVGSKIAGGDEGDQLLSEDDRGVVFFFQNNGGTFTLVNTLGDDSPAEDAIGELGLVSAFMADVDGDGDLDLFVGGAKYETEYAPENYTVTFLFLNDGGFDPTARIPVETFTGFLPTPALADVNGDGNLDFFLGGKFSAQHFLTPEQQGVAPVAAPTLSQWMLGALSGLLGLVGLSVLRRRLT